MLDFVCYMLLAYRAGRLHPRLAVDLHGEALARAYDDGRALRKARARRANAAGHQTRVDRVLQAHHFNHLVADV